MATIEKGFKYRIYPKDNQIKQIELMFKAKKYIWNYFLNINKHKLAHHKKVLNYNQMSKLLTLLKNKQIWLKQCEKSVLQNTLKSQFETFLKFFKKECGFPKFKSYKNNYQSVKMSFTNNNIDILEKEIQYTSTNKFKKQNCKIKLPKIKQVKIAYSRQYQGRIISSTLSKDIDNKYYISLCCVDIEEKQLSKTNKEVGIDLGIKEFAILSNGFKIDNPKYYNKYGDKLKQVQSKQSKCKKGSNNRNKQRLKVNKWHKKIYNCRLDFLNKLSNTLVKDYDLISLENLNVSDMLKNHNLAKNIVDASFFEFNRQLKYKSRWYGKQVIKIDRFFPSSQLCHCCGYKNEKVKDLNIREWICPNCKEKHDRDINASINILNEGLRISKKVS